MTPEEIAKKLTPAQKRAFRQMMPCLGWQRARGRWALIYSTLIDDRDDNPRVWRFTQRGLDVRAILAKEAGDA